MSELDGIPLTEEESAQIEASRAHQTQDGFQGVTAHIDAAQTQSADPSHDPLIVTPERLAELLVEVQAMGERQELTWDDLWRHVPFLMRAELTGHNRDHLVELRNSEMGWALSLAMGEPGTLARLCALIRSVRPEVLLVIRSNVAIERQKSLGRGCTFRFTDPLPMFWLTLTEAEETLLFTAGTTGVQWETFLKNAQLKAAALQKAVGEGKDPVTWTVVRHLALPDRMGEEEVVTYEAFTQDQVRRTLERQHRTVDILKRLIQHAGGKWAGS